MSDNKLGHYIFKRLCKDQQLLHKTRPRNTYGLYVNSKDLQKYVWDYFNIGLDETGIKSFEEKYWDDRDENY